MLLTISTTMRPADDLGYLLHKHPQRNQTFDVSPGVAHVFYPEASAQRCTAALLLDVDPIALARGSRDAVMGQYVNDRPYAASSLLAVALGRVFGTAMAGRCEARPGLVATPIPLQIDIPVLPCVGGEAVARSVFEPLGWRVDARGIPLDEQFPQWGDSRYLSVTLHGEAVLADALRQLYVLLPVLDDTKHYWVSPDEVDKLVRAGAGWLADHPQQELIARRYLAHQRGYVADALTRLAQTDGAEEFASAQTTGPQPLVRLRREAVLDVLREVGADSVIDVGCGEGALLPALLGLGSRVAGTDVSMAALARAAHRLEQLPDRQRARVAVFQSSLLYRDERLRGFDAMVLMEVIEHVDADRLPVLEGNVFGFAKPRTIIVTTPNVEYNVRYGVASRHRDHRFEWTREEFRDWAQRVAAAHEYTVAIRPVGAEDPELGPPTQMAVFRA